MALLTNARTTFSAIGIREDLSNIIYNISPMDTPFLSSCGRDTCDNTLFEWQTDSLAAAAANQQLEGDVPDALAVSETTRLGNYTQISFKTVATTGTAEAVDFAGRRSSQAYQMAKRAKEIKRDMEKMLTSEDLKVAGNASTARKSGAVNSWLGNSTAGDSNIIDGSNATPAGIANAGNGSSVASPSTSDVVLTMNMVNLAVKACYERGGSPDTIISDPALKVKLSALGGATLADLQTATKGDKPAHAINAVDVIVTDFGTFKFVPDRFCLGNQLYVMDWDYWSISYLRPFQTVNLAKTGDAVKQMMLAEYGLRAKNGESSGSVIGLKDA